MKTFKQHLEEAQAGFNTKDMIFTNATMGDHSRRDESPFNNGGDTSHQPKRISRGRLIQGASS